MTSKATIVIQARMGSTRLRGKSLMPVSGKPLLQRVIETAQLLTFADDIIVATTDLPEDDPIESFAKRFNINVYRGDALDVLSRFANATRHLDEKDHIVRLTADNPLNWVDNSVKLFDHYIANNCDYTCIEGLSHIVCEVMTVRALRDAANDPNLTPFDREHVTPYFRRRRDIFRSVELPADFGGLRHDLDKYLTIDTADDLYRFERMSSEANINGIVDFLLLYEWLEVNEKRSRQPDEKNAPVVFLNGVPVGDGYPTYIVAEIGQNHNGDIRIAKKLIEMAARCGADAVKFQKRDIGSELTAAMYNKPYDNPNSFGRTYGEHREFLELSEEQHSELREYATACGITYFCTVCDILSLEAMERIGSPFYKIASRDLTNIPLLEKVEATGKPVIISTGMADYDDIDDAIKTLGLPKDKLIIMQCTSEYPCRLENVNLKAMETLVQRYGYVTGLSDHTSGVIVSAASAVIGAAIVEKHITLDHTMKGSDHPGSLEEQGLRKLVDYIRAVRIAMGDGVKAFNPAVSGSRDKLARSLTTKVEIREGELITEDMLCLKSPGSGILWRNRSLVLGKRAKRNIHKDTTISEYDFE